MTTRRRQRMRIRVREDMTTQESEPAKAKPTKAKAKVKPPEPKRSPPAKNEIPQPVPEVEQAIDLVKPSDILQNVVLTPAEVGTLLRVSPSTIMKFVQDGDLPAMRVHDETRVLRRDVLAFVRSLREHENTLRQYRESRQYEKNA